MSIAALLDGLPSRRQEEADAGSTSNSRAARCLLALYRCAARAAPAAVQRLLPLHTSHTALRLLCLLCRWTGTEMSARASRQVLR